MDELTDGYSYRWMRCNSTGMSCAAIGGAINQTYSPIAEDVGHELRVAETASNFSGSSSPAESKATAVVVPPVPVDSKVPTVTGTAQQGQTLTEHHGEWTNSPTAYIYQWLRCNSSGSSCVAIGGATNQTYSAHRRRRGAQAACGRDREQRGWLERSGGGIGSDRCGGPAGASGFESADGDGHRSAGSDFDRAPW